MDGERWQKIRELFEEALEHEPRERSAFLEQACDGDAALRSEVETLLEADAIAEEEPLFGEPIRELAAEMVELRTDIELDDDLIDRVIDRYRLIRAIGQGGMGVVYLAQRADEAFDRLVAFKLVRHGIDNDEILRRFRNERRILAGLQHPSIAQLLDGGLTDDGRPYFVMEYVEGEPIDRYADRRRLTIDERLRLFLQVCDAVQYAHQHLVVHCDLKPSNVLVVDGGTEGSSGGQVKLLDFGIAKVLNPELFSSDLTQTGTLAMRPLTPHFSSPEQVLGESVTTASDAYSLGVLLCQLLTGGHPYTSLGRRSNELLGAVIRGELSRPSDLVAETRDIVLAGRTSTLVPGQVSAERATRPKALQRRLRGDLDAIVRMALRRQPEQRYGTAGQLADDIRRHLEFRSVIASGGGVGNRMAKFVRRNRIPVATGLLIALSLVGGLVGTAWQARNASAERDRAAEEADKASRIAKFLTGVFSSATPDGARGRAITALELLDAGVERLDSELAGQPEAQAQITRALGQVYYELGSFEQSEGLRERSLSLYRDLLPPAEYPDGHADLARSLGELGMARFQVGNYGSSRSLLEEALAMRRRIYPGDHQEIALSLSRLSYLLGDLFEDLETTEALRRESLEMRRRLFGSVHQSVAQGLNDLASVLVAAGRCEEAEATIRETLDIRRQLLGENHPNLTSSLSNLARVRFARGDPEGAEALEKQAIALQREHYPATHPRLGRFLHYLGAMLLAQGRVAEARAAYEESRTILENELSPRHKNAARPRVGLGKVLVLEGREKEAESLLREALAIFTATLPPEHSLTANARGALGWAISRQGRLEEAETLLQQAAEALERRRPLTYPPRRDVLTYLVELFRNSGQSELAATYQTALDSEGCVRRPGQK